MPTILNPYTHKLPAEKALPGSKRLILRPVLRSDFTQSSLHKSDLIDAKKQARAAILFEILAIAADVDLPCKPQVGDFVVVGETALDFTDPRGTTLVCHEMDVGVLYRKADLTIPGDEILILNN